MADGFFSPDDPLNPDFEEDDDEEEEEDDDR